MAALVDTNILVYRYDPRFPEKQRRAVEILYRGAEHLTMVLPHQVILEFVAATTRLHSFADGERGPLLTPQEAHREAEHLLASFPTVYPTVEVLRTALRGAAAYQLSWFDAHLWAYADFYGLPEILSEDFEHGRFYGTVRITDPFAAGAEIHEGSAFYG